MPVFFNHQIHPRFLQNSINNYCSSSGNMPVVNPISDTNLRKCIMNARFFTCFFIPLALAIVLCSPNAQTNAQQREQLTAHMIGHHHIDLIWLWPWEESVQVARATWQSVLDRMDEDPDIRFHQKSAAAYPRL